MVRKKLLKQIEKEFETEVHKENLDKWLQGVSVGDLEQNSVTIEAPNKFVMDWLKQNYFKLIRNAVIDTLGPEVEVSFRVNADLAEECSSAEPEAEAAPKTESKRKEAAKMSAAAAKMPPPDLNRKYTFDNYVTGSSNQFAYAACRAVAEKKARNYNPLFIYGGVGLGKTHLLHAIGHEIYAQKPDARVVLLQAENFMNEMIQAIRSENMGIFRKFYRKDCDVLLMDDIEILAGKERTQEEFFYTFNDLYSAGKKIIITSDKFPKEMKTLEERLRSRFESGIIVDIQPPEFETRLAILRYKAEMEGLEVPEEVLVFLAEQIKTNVRKLEGSMIRLSALSSLSGAPMNISLAEEIIHTVLDDNEARLSPEAVSKTVAGFYKVKVSDLKSVKRNRKYALPRQIAMYLCREMCRMSFPEIGSFFGGRDHSTVIHSCRKIGIDKNSDFELNKHVESLKRKLSERDF